MAQPVGRQGRAAGLASRPGDGATPNWAIPRGPRNADRRPAFLRLVLGPGRRHSRMDLSHPPKGAQRLIAPNLAAEFRRESQTADNATRLAVLVACQADGLHAAAAELAQAVFAVDPKLADDPASFRRYNAACSAAIAGCGKEKTTRLRIRRLARCSEPRLSPGSKPTSPHGRNAWPTTPKPPPISGASSSTGKSTQTLPEFEIHVTWRACPKRSERNGGHSGPRWTDSGEVDRSP